MTTKADQLIRDLGDVMAGSAHTDVIIALGSLLSQAIADSSMDLPTAHSAVDKIATALKSDMQKNWHLIEARRRRARMQ